MLRVALLCSLAVLAAAGCGGGGKSSAAVTSNLYVRGQQVYLPMKLNGSELEQHVLSMLSGSGLGTHTGWVAWVFDTDANAQNAVKALPLGKWGVSDAKVTRAIDGNVIVVASNFDGAQKPKLDAALKNLHG